MEAAFTIAEVAAFSGVDERQVRNELEQNVLEADRDLRLSFAAIVYLRLLQVASVEPREIGPSLRVDIYRDLARALSEKPRPREISPRKLIALRISEPVRETEDRIERFMKWSQRLVRDEAIKGGEPVFPKSRLDVRHVGELLLRNDAADARDELREDYPYLTDEDLEFAPLFVKAYPRVGRPTAA